MSRDYSKLIGRIIEKFRTRNAFAHAMGMSERTLSLKLNSRIEWRQSDIEKACKLLDIPISEMTLYFFVGQFKKIKLTYGDNVTSGGKEEN